LWPATVVLAIKNRETLEVIVIQQEVHHPLSQAAKPGAGYLQILSVAPILFVTYLSGIFDVVERTVPGVKGLSFTDDIAWWAEGKNEEEVAVQLEEAAAASLDWAKDNGVAFDHGKTEQVCSGNAELLQQPPSRWARVSSPSTPKRHAGWVSGWTPS
jgi:hypothetical protein